MAFLSLQRLSCVCRRVCLPEIVRGVLVEMQGQGILLKTGDSLSLVDREKLLKLTESVGKEQGASPESTAP